MPKSEMILVAMSYDHSPSSSSNTMMPPHPLSPDRLTIQNLSLHLTKGLGPSSFGLTPPPPCPATLSVEIQLDSRVVPSSTGDDTMAGLGLNYSSTTNAIRALCEGETTWRSPAHMLDGIAEMLWGFEVVQGVSASVTLPRGLLPAEGVSYTRRYSRTGSATSIRSPPIASIASIASDRRATGVDHTDTRAESDGRLACSIKGLRARTIIGLHPHERRTKQWVEVGLCIRDYDEEKWSHVDFAEEVYEVICA